MGGAKKTLSVYRFAKSHKNEIPGIKRWLNRQRPDAVIAEDVVWCAIQEMRWQVPRDIAVISVDRTPEHPDLAGFNQHHELHGIVTVDMLVGSILQNERGISEIRLNRAVHSPKASCLGSHFQPLAGEVTRGATKNPASRQKRDF